EPAPIPADRPDADWPKGWHRSNPLPAVGAGSRAARVEQGLGLAVAPNGHVRFPSSANRPDGAAGLVGARRVSSTGGSRDDASEYILCQGRRATKPPRRMPCRCEAPEKRGVPPRYGVAFNLILSRSSLMLLIFFNIYSSMLWGKGLFSSTP